MSMRKRCFLFKRNFFAAPQVDVVIPLLSLAFGSIYTPEAIAQRADPPPEVKARILKSIEQKEQETAPPVSVKIPRSFDRVLVEPEEEVVEPPAKNGMMNFAMDPDRWVDVIYSQLGGSEGTFEQQQRRKVRLTLNRVELICGVNEQIREKVQATADLEIQRFKTEVLTLASQAPRNPTQDEYQQFYTRIRKVTQPYMSVANGNNNASTLWQKVLLSNLSEQAKVEIRKESEKRQQYRQNISRLDVFLKISRRLGLTSKQRDKLEPYLQSNPQGWQNLDTAWQSLQTFPENEKKNLFTAEQIQELKNPLERSDDLQLVVREFGDDF
mgnify:CR=1 FL=1